MPRRPVIVPALLALLTAAHLSASDTNAWEQAALGLFKDAHAAFAQRADTDREARFGQAVTLLNLQPKTDANLDRAAALLESVAAADPADDLGINARYFAARVAHIHRATPDEASALARYRQLAALDSPHPLAQRALVQIALLELFQPNVAADDVRLRFDPLAARGATLTDASARRDFNLVLGDAALRFGLGDALALDHLLAADDAGIARVNTRQDAWLRIAELARRVGRTAVAVAYYRRFLADFPRDARRLMVKERLAALAP